MSGSRNSKPKTPLGYEEPSGGPRLETGRTADSGRKPKETPAGRGGAIPAVDLSDISHTMALPPNCFAGYLQEFGDVPASWSAVFDMTMDSGVLEEALSKFPDDAGLQLRRALTFDSPGEQLAALSAFTDQHPEDSLAKYGLAAVMVRQGDRQAALQELGRALAVDSPELASSDDLINRRAALRAAGYREWESGAMALRSEYDVKRFHALFGAASRLFPGHVDNLSVDEASLGVAMMAHIASSSPKDYGTEVVALAAETNYLERIPGDFEYGETGLSVEERLQVVRERMKSLPPINQIREFWRSASESDKNRIADYMLVHGEAEAFRNWMTPKE